MAFPVSEDFRYLDLFDYHLTNLMESGMLDKVQKRWLESQEISPDCNEVNKNNNDMEGFSFQQTMEIFVCLLSGIIFAIMLSLFERVSKLSKRT